MTVRAREWFGTRLTAARLSNRFLELQPLQGIWRNPQRLFVRNDNSYDVPSKNHWLLVPLVIHTYILLSSSIPNRLLPLGSLLSVVKLSSVCLGGWEVVLAL